MLAHMLKYVSLLLLVAGLFVFGIIAFTWYNARTSNIIAPDPNNNKTLSFNDIATGSAGVGPGKGRPSKTTAPEVKKESSEQKKTETTIPDGKKESSEKKSETTTPEVKKDSSEKKPETTPANKQGTPEKKPESAPSAPEKK